MFENPHMCYRSEGTKAFLLSMMLIASVFAVFTPTVASPITTTPAATAIQKLTTEVARSLAENPIEMNVILQTINKAEVKAQVEALGGYVTQVFQSVEAIAASVPSTKLLELASSRNVIRVFEDKLREITYKGALTEERKSDVPLDPITGTPAAETDGADIEVEPLTIEEIQTVEPSIYTNAYLTHADAVWTETDYGSGTIVVVIDTGVWSASPLLVGNVIGGVDISVEAGSPTYGGYNNPKNHYHGTACSHLLASHAILRFRPNHIWGEAIYRYDPEGSWKDSLGYVYVPCMGIAPAASIYGIKVFPHTGAGAPTSTIMQAIDIAIQMKANGTMDVDVISMSLGGGVGADGEDPEDLLVDAAAATGITLVAAGGNEGPSSLRVGSPGSANTAVTVGAAMDPIHEHVWGDIYFSSYYGLPPGNGWGELYWYPHDEKSIVDYSSRGPSADGRIKPEVVATGSWCFLGVFADGYIRIGGGTSYSCPQVAGEAALLTAYVEQNSLSVDPRQIKQAIYDGAEAIPGFTSMEQGAGYINILNSLNVIISGSYGTIPSTWPHHIGDLWFPPICTYFLCGGKLTLQDITLEPGKYQYFAFWTDSELDSIKMTLSGVQLADPSLQNPAFGDAGVLYVSTPERGGLDKYLFYGLYFTGDGQALFTTNVPFQPGVVRFVLAGDFSSYESVFISELTIEVTEVYVTSMSNNVCMFNSGVQTEALVEVYPGKIDRFTGSLKEGETDTYAFNIPEANGFAYVILSWYRDWAHWATTDLDLYITQPDGSLNVDGATAASPEAVAIAGVGQYTIMVDGYQVYFDKTEYYRLEIIYFADTTPLWSSPAFDLTCFAKVESPVYGLAVVWLHDKDFDTWYIGGFRQLIKTGCGQRTSTICGQR